MDYLQLGAVVTAEELAASGDGELWLAPADQQIDQAVLMPQLVDPIIGDGVEVLLNILVVAHRQSTAIHMILGPKGVHPFMALAASAAIDTWGIAECVLRTDQEPAIQVLAEHISEERKLKGFK